ncbi:transposase [Paraburkholderia bonniea]|uniref:transposase n=1 Tax=Paraburkholderia bonniea TaxID=2152891 RepID=UPI0015810B3D|nr:transposase [Paraburkholderia bonniea]WJF90953.1 transposase [Paraburkholderia bonniea]WJF94267.1 transposase [Paraburkholderia bonniea]
MISKETVSRLSDEEWDKIKHLLPAPDARKSIGRPIISSRAVLDAIYWIEESGDRWIYLPPHFPPQQTCYTKYLKWKREGILQQIHALLGRSK